MKVKIEVTAIVSNEAMAQRLLEAVEAGLEFSLCEVDSELADDINGNYKVDLEIP